MDNEISHEGFETSINEEKKHFFKQNLKKALE